MGYVASQRLFALHAKIFPYSIFRIFSFLKHILLHPMKDCLLEFGDCLGIASTVPALRKSCPDQQMIRGWFVKLSLWLK